MADKIKSPAPYFPSIEKTYGKPVDHWLEIVAQRKPAKHSELVSMLKTEHGLGHGHANALVAYAKKDEGGTATDKGN